jgi:hypothetical protein
MKIRVICQGLWTLYAICTDRGDCPLLEFLADGSSSHLAKTKRQMLRRLESIAQRGVIQVTEISHQIAEDIWQIEKGDIRILYFYDKGRAIILSHGSSSSPRKHGQLRFRGPRMRYGASESRETDSRSSRTSHGN